MHKTKSKIKEIIDAGKETTDKILERLSHFMGTEIADWNTMYAITNIKFSIEPHSEKWSGEMQFFNENNPKIENKFDSLLVSCAKSKYKEFGLSEQLISIFLKPKKYRTSQDNYLLMQNYEYFECFQKILKDYKF